jgi:hypothetical protein
MVKDFDKVCDEQLEQLDRTINRLEKHLPSRESGLPAQLPPMDCPQCSTNMQIGRLVLRSDPAAFLVLGIGFEIAWFEPDTGGKPLKVFQSTESKLAYRCPKCSMFILPGRQRTTEIGNAPTNS